jgi:hypothetical protein
MMQKNWCIAVSAWSFISEGNAEGYVDPPPFSDDVW